MRFAGFTTTIKPGWVLNGTFNHHADLPAVLQQTAALVGTCRGATVLAWYPSGAQTAHITNPSGYPRTPAPATDMRTPSHERHDTLTRMTCFRTLDPKGTEEQRAHDLHTLSRQTTT